MACDRAETEICTVAGVGQGVCCILALPGDITSRGICRDGACTNGAFRLAADACGDAVPPDLDVGADAQRSPVGDGGQSRDVLVDSAAPDGAERLACAPEACAADEVCHRETGRCVPRNFGRPGGACLVSRDCQRGHCQRSPLANSTDLGYCHSGCSVDSDCDDGVCVEDGAEWVCRRRCSDDGRCLTGWTCAGLLSDGVGACQPDCRQLGCPGQRSCDAMTGLCSAAQQRCTYPCRAGEACEGGRCVRADGTCITTYHCRAEDECFRGRCIRVEGTECSTVEGCSAGQRCAPNAQGVGECALLCQADTDCPMHRFCDPRQQVCSPRRCGYGDGVPGLHEPCSVTALPSSIGTCLPLNSMGQEIPNLEAGYCHEAGHATRGDSCDAQSNGRTPEERALMCEVGTYCIDDPDDPLEPVPLHLGRGQCRALCRPGNSECGDSERCIRMAPRDDPETSVMEGYELHLCHESNCGLFQGDCADGAYCDPLNLWSAAGQCSVAGTVEPGGICESSRDCMQASQCVSQAGDQVCMSICHPESLGCVRGQCYQDPTWAYGLCVGG